MTMCRKLKDNVSHVLLVYLFIFNFQLRFFSSFFILYQNLRQRMFCVQKFSYYEQTLAEQASERTNEQTNEKGEKMAKDKN